jgi:small subunit ribosomal protein S6
MRHYETLYIIQANLGEEEYEGVISKYHDIIEKNKGVVIDSEKWGQKNLAYNIKKLDKGNYVLLQFCGATDTIREVEREMRLDERVLKYQTIKLSDHADPEDLKGKAQEAIGPADEEADQDGTNDSETEEETRTEDEAQDGIQS